MTTRNRGAIPLELDLDAQVPQFRERLLHWYGNQRRDLPWRILWRQHHDPYHVWVSEIMLQQTVIKAVIPAYERFLRQFPDVHTLAQATEADVRLASRGLGYYRRFGLMHRAAQQLSQQLQSPGGAWPQTYREWLPLPGIGAYTAAAISSIAFGFPKAVVDGNVERLFCRLFDLREPPNGAHLKKQFQRIGDAAICPRQPGDFNQAMMEMGQTLCTKASPDCDACPFQDSCLSRRNESQHLAPAAKDKTPFEDVVLAFDIPRRGDEIGLIYRDEGWKFLKNSWGFPYRIHTGQKTPDSHRGRFTHAITNHRITAFVRNTSPKTQDKFRWIHRDKIQGELVASLDQKALRAVMK